MASPVLTHIAMSVRNIEQSVNFYSDFCGFQVVHDRGEGARRVVWMSPSNAEPMMVLVIMEGHFRQPQHKRDYSHLGFALSSKTEVDDIARKAERAGVLMWAPKQEPFPVGYYCGLKDPDGQFVEFSYGQPLGKGAPKLDLSSGDQSLQNET